MSQPIYGNEDRPIYLKILTWVTDIMLIIAVALFVLNFYGYRYTASGSSMSPTVNAKEIILVDRITFQIFSPDRFDLILVEMEKDGLSQYYLKRVIGIPGDSIQINNGKIYLNDELLTYGDNMNEIISPGLAHNKIQLKKDEYFVLGDNWNNSEDSRFVSFGNVQKENIIGIAWFRISPTEKLGFIE